MGIGEIKGALTGFVKEAGKRTAEAAKAVALAPVLTAKLLAVENELTKVKGWGPEAKAQRAPLEAEQKRLLAAIQENNRALPPTEADIVRNLRR